MPCGSALKTGAFAGALLVLSGCQGAIIATYPEDPETGAITADVLENGAVYRYALPKGMLRIKGSYDYAKNILKIDEVASVSVPDPEHSYNLVYQHQDNSHDSFSLTATPGGLLKTISTTDDDRTAAIAAKSVELLQSVATAAKAIDSAGGREQAFVVGEDADEFPPKDERECGTITFQKIVEIENLGKGTRKAKYLENLEGSCYIVIEYEIIQNNIMNTFYQKPQLLYEKPKFVQDYIDYSINYANAGNCYYAVCFRFPAQYEIKIYSYVKDIKNRQKLNQKGQVIENITVDSPVIDTQYFVTAPHIGQLGILFFNRRAFVKNTTTATFENGMLTGLTVDNPSQIEGFLSIPVELLKAVPILIAVN